MPANKIKIMLILISFSVSKIFLKEENSMNKRVLLKTSEYYENVSLKKLFNVLEKVFHGCNDLVINSQFFKDTNIDKLKTDMNVFKSMLFLENINKLYSNMNLTEEQIELAKYGAINIRHKDIFRIV